MQCDNLKTKISAMSVSIPKEKFDINDFDIDKDTLKRTMKLTGIHSVRLAPENMTAFDYCADAAERLIDEINFDKSQIDGIIFACAHHDYHYPGNGNLLQSRLGLQKKCAVIDTTHACTGMLYSIMTADMLIKMQYCKNVLVCCGDTSGKHVNPRDRALRTVVGDGGGAALLTLGDSESMAFSFVNDGDGVKYLYTPAGGERMPVKAGVTDQESADDEGNFHSLENEYMDGLEVMRFALNEVPPLIEDVLAQKQWSKDDVDLFVFHQANEFMLHSLRRKLKISKEKVLIRVDGIGNIGGASIVLAMCQEAQNKSQAWKRVVVAGFGAGLSGMAVTADLSRTHFCKVNTI